MFAARKKLLAGDQFTVDYLPGRGTVIAINGQPQGEPIKEPEFFNALMRILARQIARRHAAEERTAGHRRARAHGRRLSLQPGSGGSRARRIASIAP